MFKQKNEAMAIHERSDGNTRAELRREDRIATAQQKDCQRHYPRLSYKGPESFQKPGRESSCWDPSRSPKPDEAKPKMPGAVPANGRKPMPIDVGPVSGCFDHDPKLLDCEIASPSIRVLCRGHRPKSQSEHPTPNCQFQTPPHPHAHKSTHYIPQI